MQRVTLTVAGQVGDDDLAVGAEVTGQPLVHVGRDDGMTKVLFDEALASPEALRKNSYSKELWLAEGLAPRDAALSFAQFLRSCDHRWMASFDSTQVKCRAGINPQYARATQKGPLQ